MGTLMAVLATLAFCSCAVVLVVRSTVRAVRRRLLGLREAAVLRARSHGVGPVAEVARLRRDMERSLGGARRALAAAQTVQAPVGDVRSLLAGSSSRRARSTASCGCSSRSRTGPGWPPGLAGARVRAGLVTTSAADLVDGLLHAAGHQDDELSLLHAACAIEAEALRASACRCVESIRITTRRRVGRLTSVKPAAANTPDGADVELLQDHVRRGDRVGLEGARAAVAGEVDRGARERSADAPLPEARAGEQAGHRPDAVVGLVLVAARPTGRGCCGPARRTPVRGSTAHQPTGSPSR